MRRIWEWLNVFRSIPAIYMYRKSPSRDEIRRDIVRAGYVRGYTGTWRELHKTLLRNATFRNLFYYRTHKTFPVLTLISKLLLRPSMYFGIDAGSIGGGLVIFHGHSTLVMAESIGQNCCIYQQVSIGRGKMINGRNIPIIGDNVNIYAGAIVVGGIRIGNNVSIGAGAVVVKDVPDNTTVVSAPVRMITKETLG